MIISSEEFGSLYNGKRFLIRQACMAAKCDRRRYSTRKELSFSKEDSTGYNLRKKDRLIKEKDDFSLGSKSTIVEVSRRV